jgi:clan AA aspartic protease
MPAARSGARWRRCLAVEIACEVAGGGRLCQFRRMGTVKATVSIRNATDVGMSRRGILPPDQIRSVTVEAVVDTGAVRSCIPVDLKEKLGLEAIRHINAQMANGQTDGVELTDAAYVDIMDRVATESFLVLGSEVLIGQTALESTDLLVDCNRQCVITNPDHPNSAVIRIR